jgi:hypothetical protein
MRHIHIVGVLAGAALLAGTAPSVAVRTPTPVLKSPCVCIGCHGSYRADVKRDTEPPPAEIPTDHRVTPSDIAAWPGAGGVIHAKGPRAGRELEWYAVTGRVVAARIESDGDLHLQLVDTATRRGQGLELIVEIPSGDAWCSIRQQVLSWTTSKPPLRVGSGAGLTLSVSPDVEVVGRAFYDAEHAVGADTRANRRACADGARCAIWEIHPVMRIGRI